VNTSIWNDAFLDLLQRMFRPFAKTKFHKRGSEP